MGPIESILSKRVEKYCRQQISYGCWLVGYSEDVETSEVEGRITNVEWMMMMIDFHCNPYQVDILIHFFFFFFF